MGFFDFLRPRPQLHIADCLNRKITSVTTFPASLSGKSHSGKNKPLCRVAREKKRFYLEAMDPNDPPFLDGKLLDDREILDPDYEYALSLRGHLLVICIRRGNHGYSSDFRKGRWMISELASQEDETAIEPEEQEREQLERIYREPGGHIARPEGSFAVFPLRHLIAALPEKGGSISDFLPPGPPEAQPPVRSSPPASYGIDAAIANVSETARHTCPTCWKAFGVGDVLNIAAHEELKGDPVLGKHAKLRFAPERFNEIGQALDPMGVVSLDLACPHCRGRLPASFLSQEQLICSLVGAPSSGKSYYLAVLLELLPEECIQYFDCHIQDGDPSGNVQLNEMKNRLFSATTPEDAFISKTDFEGLMYDKLFRNGKLVSLPRPFVYHLARKTEPPKRLSLVFYDNAGEHFKPTISLDDSPGALHVAASDALFFLFDPTTNRRFRKALNRKRDVQLKFQSTDEQDTILTEMGIRVKRLRGLESHEQVDTPLALMVGKLDIWESLLEPGSIAIPEGRPLDQSEIARNSRITKRLLERYCPIIVANAESISSNVLYFPLSSLGHSPKVLEKGPLEGKLAPIPRKLNPTLVTTPTLWAINESHKGIFPIAEKTATEDTSTIG